VDLPEAQRASLEALTRQDGYDGSVSARAQIVLWRADGFSVGDIVRVNIQVRSDGQRVETDGVQVVGPI
jgi:hypothetical protein